MTRRAARPAKIDRQRSASPGFYVVAGITVLVSFFPTIWLFLTSIKTEATIYAFPVVYLPAPPTLDNYLNIFNETPELLRYILNSFIVATTTTIVILAFGGLAAYSLGRLTWRGRGPLLIFILAVSMFPPLALLPSLFSMFLDLRLINSYPGLIIGHTGLYLPIAIWILSNFFQTVPREIEDAARVDGATSLRIFWRIILPLSAPGLISTGLIVFIFSWNEFPLSLVLMSDNFMRTAPVGISLFPGEYSFPWEIITAATMLTITPILIISGLFQDRLIGGLTAGSGK
ncbi:MAG: carbohydrate ABC transporter permease [Chloroflexi bacterium]|nr:carbohydrate ABC transporter permease [Chloroflexota bacterium]